jgi:hypothetical protein
MFVRDVFMFQVLTGSDFYFEMCSEILDDQLCQCRIKKLFWRQPVTLKQQESYWRS